MRPSRALLNIARAAIAAVTLGLVANAFITVTPSLSQTCDLTGDWCCQSTHVRQSGDQVFSTADYGNGTGTLQGNVLMMTFTNHPTGPVTGALSPDCNCVSWSNGASWHRAEMPDACSNWPPVKPAVPPPSWSDDLIIYEINPKTFTSPNGTGDGSGSGTLLSAIEQLPRLASLGVNGIWLAGWCLGQQYFFSGIWSSYGAARLDVIDPTLGGDDALKAFVQAAHQNGIRVILDVTTHGVVNTSTLISEQPTWFKGNGTQGSWHMIDYDYTSAGFREFYVQTFNTLVDKFQVDGFRLDVGITGGTTAEALARPLWDDIVRHANASGHPIVIMPEVPPRYHFLQHDTKPSNDVAKDFTPTFGPDKGCLATVQISCHDNGHVSPPGNWFAVQGSRSLLGYSGIFSYNIVVMMAGEEFDAAPSFVPRLSRGFYGMNTSCNAAAPPGADICYGPGGWLYGNQLIWSLTQPQWDMHNDTARMLAIRQAHRDVLHSNRCRTNVTAVQCAAASHSSRVHTNNSDCEKVTSPASGGMRPYARFIPGKKIVLIAANPTLANTTIQLDVASQLLKMGFSQEQTCFSATDVWLAGSKRQLSRSALAAYPVTMLADKTPRGGIAVHVLAPTTCTPS